MFTSKSGHWDDKGIITTILSEVKDVAKIEIWSEANSNATIYKVLNGKGKVAYLVKQYRKSKSEDGLILKERAKKEKEVSDLLCQCTPYVGRVVDVRSEEYTSKDDGSVYVVTELLLECGGIDILQYSKQVTVDQPFLLNVMYQSALAIATAHLHGIFPCNIKPQNMLYNENTLKLIEFGVSSIMESKTFIDEYRKQMTPKMPGCTPQFCPPEVQYYESVKEDIPVSLSKIDVYCWGMSMLQFLSGMSDEKLGELTSTKCGYEDWCGVLNTIIKIRIPIFSEETSVSIMRLITRCLEYNLSVRFNMDDVLACLVGSSEEFSTIISSLPDHMRKKYLIEIHDLLKQYQFSSHIPKEVKYVEEKKMLQTEKKNLSNEKTVDKIDSLLVPALKHINQLLDSKEIFTNPLFQQIASTKEKKMKLKHENLNCLTVAAGLMRNSTLTELDLSRNNIGITGVAFIATALQFNSTLTELNLRNNNIGNTGAIIIATALQSSSTLTKLDLCRNMIDNTGVEFLATALQSNSTLTKLVLWSNNIGDTGAGFIATALQFNSTLTELNLCANMIDDTGVEFIATALQSNSTLTKLNLSENKIGGTGAEFLATALQSNSTLTKLNLRQNNIGDTGVEFIATALQLNSTLTKFVLKETNIDDTGAEFIATALQSNFTLSELDLSENNIGDTGVEFIATALQLNSTITKLVLCENNIGVTGAGFIITTLQSNSSLTELDLSCNKICGTWDKYIATSLQSSSTLIKLNLGYNSICDTGAEIISTALQSYSAIIKLDLSRNNIGDNGVEFIATALQSNSTLTKLNLSNNKIYLFIYIYIIIYNNYFIYYI